MSRNFELLQKAERLGQLFASDVGGVAGSFSGNGHPPAADVHPKEEANKLVQMLFPSPGTPGPRAVVFAGVGDGAGSAEVCAMTAEALAARAIGSVCVVDSNFRSPSLHKWFDIDNLDGLADGLLQPGPIRTVARRIADGNLWLLPCGTRTVSPRSLATMDRLTLRLSELRGEFEYVLIHAAAADKYSDASVLGRLADGVILVVEANSTPRETVQKTKQSLDSAEIRLLGAVLNNRTFPIPQAIYSRLR